MSPVSNATMGQMQIAVAKMQLANVEQEGKNALALIDSSAPAAGAPANAAAGVGERLNVVA